MSSNKYKIYDVEVILRYKINNITRDYTLCSSDNKSYDVERILNKNIYDYINNINDNKENNKEAEREQFKKYFKKIKGNLNIPLETNYLDVKIIEQIFNSTSSENIFKLDEFLIEKINDHINIITKTINENINPNIKNLEKYYFNDNENCSQNEFLENILTKIIEKINTNEDLKNIFTVETELKEEEKQYIDELKKIINIQSNSGDEIIKKIIYFLTNDTNKKNNILYKELNYPYAFIFLPDNLTEIIKTNKEKIKNDNKNIEIHEYSITETSNFNYLTIKTNLLHKETDRENTLAYIKLLSKVIANTKNIFNFNINTEIDKCRNLILFYFYYKNVILVKKKNSKFIDFLKSPVAIESLPNIIKKTSTNSDTNSSEHIITLKLDDVLSFIYDYIQSYKSNNNLIDLNIYADFLDEYIKLCEKIKLGDKIDKLNITIKKILSNDKLNYYEYTLLIKYVTKYLNMQNIKLNNASENESIFDNIIKILNEICSKEIFELKASSDNGYSKYFQNMHKSENKNEIQIFNFIQINNIIKNTLDYYKDNNSKEGSPLYYFKKNYSAKEDYELFKTYIDSLLSTILNFIYKLNITVDNGELRRYLEKDQSKYDEDTLIEKFNSSDLSIFDLFLKKEELDTGEKTDKYINTLFNILNKDLILYEKYKSGKEFRSDLIKENLDIELLPKGYNTSEKKKEILINYGKYFNYFTGDKDIEDEYLSLERNKDDVKRIITYYNIYHILKYLYLPKGTIINDIIYDVNENKEINQFFTINDIQPILQKKEVDYIKNNKIRVFFDIDYTINKFNSYIELNINFYNSCEQMNIVEKDNNLNDEADYNTIVFTKDNDITKYNFKGLFSISDSDSAPELESSSENKNVNKFLLEYIKKCILKNIESESESDDSEKIYKIISNLKVNLQTEGIDSNIDMVNISSELFEKLNIDNILNFKHEITYAEPDKKLLKYLKNDKKYNSEEIIDIIFNDNLKKIVDEENNNKSEDEVLNSPKNKKITYELKSNHEKIEKINNDHDIKKYIIGEDNIQDHEKNEIIANFSNKIGDNKEIKLTIGELSYLSIDYNIFKKMINDVTIENIIKINNNIYSFNYDIEMVLMEDKYSKQLYEIYDASILDKNFNPTKIYFDDSINYEKIRSDYDKLTVTNDIFIKNKDKINDLEDTFLIEETANFYNLKYKDTRENSENAEKILHDLFIDYFYFKKNNDLLIDGKYYNIRNVEIIAPKKLKLSSEKNYLKKQSNDIRLKYKEVDNIYQIYLYINYYKKEKKTDEVPIEAILSSGSNCIAKANILDKKLENLLGDQYEQKFFTKKLLNLLNQNYDSDDDEDIKKLKSMGADDVNSSELNSLTENNIDDNDDIKKLESMGIEDDNNDINIDKLKQLGKNDKIKGGNKKKTGKKKYHKPKKYPRLKTKNRTIKLIKDYLKNNYLFII